MMLVKADGESSGPNGGLTIHCENVIFSLVTLRSDKAKGRECCVTRWCLIKELNYYQTHPQQHRIASRRLCFCNIALHKGHTLIHMTTSLAKLKTIHAVCW